MSESTEIQPNGEPWALARIGEADRIDRFPAILALRCADCGRMGARGRMTFRAGTSKDGQGVQRVPVCIPCHTAKGHRRTLRVAVADRRAP